VGQGIFIFTYVATKSPTTPPILFVVTDRFTINGIYICVSQESYFAPVVGLTRIALF
jgi:hypothetical protein